MKKSGIVLGAACAAFAACGLAVAQLAGGATATVRTVADHLNNPRGLEIGPDGALYIAEAGAAGKRCVKSPEGEQCAGFSSAILRVAGGSVRRYATGFLSGGGRDGSFSTGMDDIAVTPGGVVYAIVTSFGPKPEQYGPQVAAQSGWLLRVDHGRKTSVANIADREFRNNPDGANVDSDPYSVAWSPSGLAVADAAGNSLLSVDAGGRVSVLATFRPQRFHGVAAQSVPTTVVWHNGAFYVGELGGGPTPPGGARIWRVVPGQKATVVARGFTAVTGIAFGPDGSLYVSELAKKGLAALEGGGDIVGAVIRVAPDGSRRELAPGKLIAPAGIAVASDGTVYVSVNSVFARRGSVVAISQS